MFEPRSIIFAKLVLQSKIPPSLFKVRDFCSEIKRLCKNSLDRTKQEADRISTAALEKILLSAFAVREKRKKTVFEKGMRVLAYCAAIMVTLTTSIVLILPAIAMETDEDPVVPAHTHNANCYTQVTSTTERGLICTSVSAGVHTHTAECSDENGTLVCAKANFVVHSHNNACFDENGVLVCPLEVVKEHTHDSTCYVVTRGEIECGLEESEGHTHELFCYDAEGNLVCELEESEGHTHTEECCKKIYTLSCSEKEISLHTHSSSCYDDQGKVICGKLEVRSHAHSDDCFGDISIPVDTETLTCTQTESEGHTHSLECYGTDGSVVCGIEEGIGHTHGAMCYGTWVLTCTIPTDPQPEQQPDESETVSDSDVISGSDAVVSESDVIVPDDEVVISESDVVVSDSDTVVSESDITVSESDVTVSDSDVVSDSDLPKLTEEEKAQVEETIALLNALPTSDEIEFAIAEFDEAEDLEGLEEYFIKNTARCQLANWAYEELTEAQKKHVHNIHKLNDIEWFWSVSTFVTLSKQQKAAKNNSSQLSIVQGLDTAGYIEINLFDYNASINNNWKSNKKYPGFQQYGGSRGASSIYSVASSNFGDNITTDITEIAKVTNQGGVINSTNTAHGINAAVTGAMMSTLGSDGYPALADGSSLSYLFTNSGAAKKLNSSSINGLFLPNAETHGYSYNSRHNHAQFNAGSNTFTLYNQILTPNPTMYPFGNFLPLNDIVEDSKRLSDMDRAYFMSIGRSALYKAGSSTSNIYYQLGKGIETWVTKMDADSSTPASWNYRHAIGAYFALSGPMKDKTYVEAYSTIAAAYNAETGKNLADNLYCLDYDEPTNFFFGMEIKTTLTQPKDGCVGEDTNGDGKYDIPMHFYFTGDDDVWVYIDGVLFLDLTGIHRHVGGEIDFEKGEVYYYVLDPASGDVSTSPYITKTFAEILTAAGRSTNVLNAKGTFYNYTQHEFKFYYMERGAGSGVCKINFNFPFLNDNSLTVEKELSVPGEDIDILGNPDFYFQILKADGNGEPTEELYVGSGVLFDIYEGDTKVGKGITKENGLIAIKAGQKAVFPEIREDTGAFFVRELLNVKDFEQYGEIIIDGVSNTITSSGVQIGSSEFHSVLSTLVDISNGNSSFKYNNILDRNKLASLSIRKELNTYDGEVDEDATFDIHVELDGTPLPVGTEYTVGTENRTVSAEGIITLKADETATIAHILSGTTYVISEDDASAAGYTVTYSGDGDDFSTDGSCATGIVRHSSTVGVVVTNDEIGATIVLNGSKTLTNPDGQNHSYTIKLSPVTDMTGTTAAEGITLEADVTVGADGYDEFSFVVQFLEREIEQIPTTLYYRIVEVVDNELLSKVTFDSTVYVIAVDIAKDGDTLTAELVGMEKDGVSIMPSADIPLVFTNTLLEDFTLSKNLSGLVDDGTLFYTFDIAMSFNGNPVVGSFSSTTPQGHVVFDENGCTSVTVAPGDTVVIYGLPESAIYTVTERNTDEYQVNWVFASGESSYGSSVSGTLVNSESTLVCNNIFCYELPSTGGFGSEVYIICGMMLTSFALFMLLRKKRKELVCG